VSVFGEVDAEQLCASAVMAALLICAGLWAHLFRVKILRISTLALHPERPATVVIDHVGFEGTPGFLAECDHRAEGNWAVLHYR
jgi:hypothetical protein